MPFIKPKPKCFNIIIVGDKGFDVTKLFYCVGNDSNDDLECPMKDKISYLYRRKGFEAKINIWQMVNQQCAENVVPNFFRGAHLVVITCNPHYLLKDVEFFYNNSQLRKWNEILDHVLPEVKRIVVLPIEFGISVSESLLTKLTFDYQFVQTCVLRQDAGTPAGKLFLQTLCKYLLDHENWFYNDLRNELKSVDLTTDKNKIVNSTQCYERNGIA